MTTAISFSLQDSAVSPSAQYSLWTQALGVSDTTTLMTLDGDDVVRAFTLTTGCLNSTYVNAEFSTEGLIGWSGSPKLNQAVPNWFSRMYYVNSQPPDYFFAFRFENNDCQATGVKLQQAQGVTILTGHIKKLSTSGEDIEFAMRFPANSTDLPELLLKVVSLPANLYAWRLLNATINYAVTTVAAGTQAKIVLQTVTYYARKLPAALGHRILVPEHAAALKFNHRAFHKLAVTRNHYYQGKYRITGTVKQKGQPFDLPVARRVLLIDERANFVVRETWSDPLTGRYSFDYINPDIQYLVIAYDYKQNFRAAIADNLTAEPMP